MPSGFARHLPGAALPLCIAAMDGCWVYAVGWMTAALIAPQDRPGAAAIVEAAAVGVPSPVALAAVQLLGWWLAGLLLDRTTLPVRTAQIVSGAAGLGASVGITALTNPTPYPVLSLGWIGASGYGLALLFALWVVGVYRAAERPAFNMAYTGFRVGLSALGLAVLIITMFGGARAGAAWEAMGELPLWFFGWGLAALALGNRETVRQESGYAGAGTWVLALGVGVGGVMLAGGVAGAAGGQNVLVVAQNLALAVIRLAGGLVYAVLLAAFWLFNAIVGDVLHPMAPPKPLPGDAASYKGRFGIPTPTPGPELMARGAPPELRDIALWVGVALVVLAAVFLLTRGLQRTRRPRTHVAHEERESLGSWEMLLRQAREWLRMLTGKQAADGQEARPSPEDDLAALAAKPEWSGSLTVRQIYARMQRLAANTGHPRAPQQTPVEYLAALSEAIPQLRGDFADITAAYIEARYGPLPASGPAVLAAGEAWKRAEPVLLRAAASPASAKGRA